MRTTLYLDDYVAHQLAAIAQRDGRSVSQVANQVLRSGLHAASQVPALKPYDPPTFDTGQALVDVSDVAEVLDGVAGYPSLRGPDALGESSG